MAMQRREWLALMGAMATMGWPSVSAVASSTPITVVVPFPPGGGGDTLARAALDPVAKVLGEKIVVVNRPGAGGNIGTSQVVRAGADGHTFGYVTNGIYCVNPHLYGTKTFDPMTDLMPVGQLSVISLVMVLNLKAMADVTDFASLLEKARQSPGTVPFASAGVGTTSHMAGALLSERSGIEFQHIPHAGGAAAIAEVLAGRIPFMIDVMPNVMPHIQAGALKALAVTTPQRSPLLPEVPVFAELGVKDCTLFAWDGFVAPKGTSVAEIERFSQALNQALAEPTVAQRFKNRGAITIQDTPEQFAAFVKDEAPRWEALVKTVRGTK